MSLNLSSVSNKSSLLKRHEPLETSVSRCGLTYVATSQLKIAYVLIFKTLITYWTY